jgi:hypothetical protein
VPSRFLARAYWKLDETEGIIAHDSVGDNDAFLMGDPTWQPEGQYIANAVLLLCHGEPQPLLDVNMARVLERVFGPKKLADIRYDPYLQQLAMRIVQCKKPARTAEAEEVLIIA